MKVTLNRNLSCSGQAAASVANGRAGEGCRRLVAGRCGRAAEAGCGGGGNAVESLESWSPDGYPNYKFTTKMQVGLLAGPPADALAEGCKDMEVEAPEAPRRPLGKRG